MTRRARTIAAIAGTALLAALLAAGVLILDYAAAVSL